MDQWKTKWNSEGQKVSEFVTFGKKMISWHQLKELQTLGKETKFVSMHPEHCLEHTDFSQDLVRLVGFSFTYKH